MSTAIKAPARPTLDEDVWDSRALGASLEHAEASAPEKSQALDDALGLQAISIRLPRQLIEQFKLIAQFHAVGYQPLMRDVLSRFVPGAMQEILESHLQARADAEKARAEEDGDDREPPQRKAA